MSEVDALRPLPQPHDYDEVFSEMDDAMQESGGAWNTVWGMSLPEKDTDLFYSVTHCVTALAANQSIPHVEDSDTLAIGGFEHEMHAFYQGVTLSGYSAVFLYGHEQFAYHTLGTVRGSIGKIIRRGTFNRNFDIYRGMLTDYTTQCAAEGLARMSHKSNEILTSWSYDVYQEFGKRAAFMTGFTFMIGAMHIQQEMINDRLVQQIGKSFEAIPIEE